MKKQFYSHIIEYESLIIELDKLDLSDEQKEHLLELIESSLHHTVLDAILSELSVEDKQKFLDYLSYRDHDTILEFLHTKVENIEEKIKKAAEDLKKELHKDLKEVSEK